MAIRVKTKANLIASADKDGKDRLFGLDDGLSETVLDGFTEVVSGTAALALNGVHTVPLGSIADVRGVFLKVSGACAVSINGGLAIQLRPGIVGPSTVKAGSAKLLLEGLVSSVVLTAGEALTASWCCWGDPIA